LPMLICLLPMRIAGMAPGIVYLNLTQFYGVGMSRYSVSHSSRLMPACRGMRARNSPPMSPRWGLGIHTVTSPLTMY